MAPSPSDLTAAAPRRMAPMLPRSEAHPFLDRSGWGSGEILPLAGDASFRRYFRVVDGGRIAVLMDAPPEHEDVRAFVAMAVWLRESGFSAPQIIASDMDHGFLLLEDFGDRIMGPELAAHRAEEEQVYGDAVDILVELHRRPAPEWLKPYDRDALLREVLLFPEWYAKAADLKIDVEAYVAAWDAVWQTTIAETLASPVAVLRDYHAENLLLLDRPGVRSLGLLDFQDALAGHPAYDLVSLLQDARRTVSPRLELRMMSRFAAGSGIDDLTPFRVAYDVLGAQRNSKILGIFVRLRDRDGRIGYVERLPRVWNYLERNLTHPALAPLAEWFDAYVPAEKRSEWCL